MDQPASTGQVIDYYYAGERCELWSSSLKSDGYKWLGYLSYSGSRRYVQYAELSNTEKGWKKKEELELPENGNLNWLEENKWQLVSL